MANPLRAQLEDLHPAIRHKIGGDPATRVQARISGPEPGAPRPPGAPTREGRDSEGGEG